MYNRVDFILWETDAFKDPLPLYDGTAIAHMSEEMTLFFVPLTQRNSAVLDYDLSTLLKMRSS